MSKLVIVESPSKAKSIGKYLGKSYKVVACMGHVRDLPKSRLGVDIEKGFEPEYIIIRGKAALVKELKKYAKDSDKVFLAADPDREGEAISWHLATVLGLKENELNRVTFNEITKTGVKAGIAQPRTIDKNLVDAQQARRVLDRVVGYKLSPFLWKKIRPGLSAGRVQSVAVRIIVDRENEISAFVPEEYWSIDAILNGTNGKFTAGFYGDKDGKIEIADGKTADIIKSVLDDTKYTVSDVKKGSKLRNPAAPFTTSTLQQESSRKLGFSSKKTMSVAQTLYEGVDTKEFGTQGLITYMRTDSLRISVEASDAARKVIAELFGNDYLPETTRVYKSRQTAQDAHEAIRPSNPAITPDSIKTDLTSDQYKLYKLIWERFIACQMKSAVIDTVTVDIAADKYVLKANGQTIRFGGFTALYEEGKDEKQEETQKLPEIKQGDELTLISTESKQHFTQPPQRYTEATLIKALEENGIGRPSTYAPTIAIITERDYVSKKGKTFCPTPLGIAENSLMCEHFPNIVDIKFTAKMEDDLDKVADGKMNWVESLDEFYDVFGETLNAAEQAMGNVRVEIEDEVSDVICEKCGRNMVIKHGRYGKFLACPGYPDCKNTRKMGDVTPPQVSEQICEQCGKPMLVKNGKYGKFLACAGYPECKNIISLAKEYEHTCPKCGGTIVQRFTKKHKSFYGCKNYPTCNFVSWDEPTADKCPSCGRTLFIKHGKSGDRLYCADEKCSYIVKDKNE